MAPLVLALLVLAGAILLTAAPARAQTGALSIGTGGVSGVYYAAGRAFCLLLELAREAELDKGIAARDLTTYTCRVEETPGSVHNLERVLRKEMTFGLVQSDVHFDAYVGGRGESAGRANADLRSVFSLHGEPLQILVGKQSGINRTDDLRGKRISIGEPGAGYRVTFDRFLAAEKLPLAAFRSVSELSARAQVLALCDGQIDAFVYVVGVPNAAVARATEACGARILTLGGRPLRGLINRFPAYQAVEIPQETYGTLTAPVETLAVTTTVVTHAETPEAIVFDLARATFTQLDILRDLHPAFRPLRAEDMSNQGLFAPLHPGAEKYFRLADVLAEGAGEQP